MQRRPRRGVLGILVILACLLVAIYSVQRHGGGQSPASSQGTQLPAASTRNQGPGGTRTTADSSGSLAGTVVFLDPGHGGVDHGTMGYTADGDPVAEKTVTLQIALRTAQRLRALGATVVLSRTDDSLPGSTAADFTDNHLALTADGVLNDLQRRIDKANAAGAQVLLSIHMNAFTDPSVGGTETYYDASRPFADRNRRFARLVQQELMDAFDAEGYQTPNRGVTSDAQVGAESVGALPASYNHLVMLGPAVPGKLRPSRMPGALSEVFFLTDPSEASAVVQPQVQDLIAGAFTRAIQTFLTTSGE